MRYTLACSILFLTLWPLGALAQKQQPEKPKPEKRTWPPEIEKILNRQIFLQAKVGDETVYQVSLKMPGLKYRVQQSQRIVSVTAKEVILEVVNAVPGSSARPSRKTKIARKLTLRRFYEMNAAKNSAVTQMDTRLVSVDREKLVLFGKTYQTYKLTYQGKVKQGVLGGTFTARHWFSNQVPCFSLVKSVVMMNLAQQGAGIKSRSSMILLRHKRDQAGVEKTKVPADSDKPKDRGTQGLDNNQ